jgi:peroxiredoxin
MKNRKAFIQHRLFKLFLVLNITWLTLLCHAEQKSIEVGPEIGATIPQLNLLDQFSNRQEINNILGEKGAIITVFRSADWCPFCKSHLKELKDETESFKKLGYGVVAISYDSPEILREFSQDEELNFALLSDQNVESFKALKMVNMKYQPGDRHYGIPYPGVIIINSDGIVTHKYFFEGYRSRVKFDELVKQLRTMK